MPPLHPDRSIPRKILVTRIRRIGDVILTLPVLDTLREAFPLAEIDYLAEAGPAEAAKGHPALRRVLSFHGVWTPLPAPPGLLARLRSARYDWVIDLYGNPRSALLSLWSGAPVRVGPGRPSRRKLYTHTIPAAPSPRTAVEHHLAALEPLGIPAARVAPKIHLTDAEREGGARELDRHLPPGGPRVGLHVGNRWPAKRWPEERFQALLRVLSRAGVRGIVLAGPGEEARAQRVGQGVFASERRDAPVLSGLPLRSYFAVVASLDALVTNDGSPLHIGPAVGTPTVGILGPTVPEIWFPYDAAEGHQLLCKEIWCRPCHRHECARLDCLEWIEVREAAQAVSRALNHHAERVGASA